MSIFSFSFTHDDVPKPMKHVVKYFNKRDLYRFYSFNQQICWSLDESLMAKQICIKLKLPVTPDCTEITVQHLSGANSSLFLHYMTSLEYSTTSLA